MDRAKGSSMFDDGFQPEGVSLLDGRRQPGVSEAAKTDSPIYRRISHPQLRAATSVQPTMSKPAVILQSCPSAAPPRRVLAASLARASPVSSLPSGRHAS